ncbi:MAG: DUF882 domain-containing protein [Psychroserpens sp.]|nr:DUF882 domain-containing protein [Psychroserpens sp.]
MKLTINFNLSEFQSKDGSPMPSNVLANVRELANALQTIRASIGVPLNINSAYRSPEHNKRVGGSPNSQHLLGKAADLSNSKLPPAQLAEVIEELISRGYIPEGGIGIYNTFVHYDIRGTKARWDNRR